MIMFFFARPLCMLAGLLYPAYKSFKALETPAPEDDRQWLTYWVIMAFFTFIEYFADSFLFWLPFYYEAKLAFILWLQLPQFNGARWLYETHLQPMLKQHEAHIDEHIASVGATARQAFKRVSQKGMEAVTQAISQGAQQALSAAASGAATTNNNNTANNKGNASNNNNNSNDQSEGATLRKRD
jgi:receptor expression-enhancing protein 5/6